MERKSALLYVSLAIFAGMLVVSVATEGTGIVKNDPSRNIFIPDELMMPLQVKAAYNGRDSLFRYRWPSKRPGVRFVLGWRIYATHYHPDPTIWLFVAASAVLIALGLWGRYRHV